MIFVCLRKITGMTVIIIICCKLSTYLLFQLLSQHNNTFAKKKKLPIGLNPLKKKMNYSFCNDSCKHTSKIACDTNITHNEYIETWIILILCNMI